MIRSLAGLLFANAAFLVAGAGLVRFLGFRLRASVGVAYMAGVASVGVISTLLLMAGLALRGWQALVLCGSIAALGLVRRERPETTAPKTDWRVAGPAAGLLGGYLAVLFVQCLFQALNSWDAWAKWTMKARAIVLLGGLDTSVFANQAYRPLVLDYPMLIPALEAIDFRFMGRLDNLVVHVQFWLLLVGFLVAAFELLRDRVPQTLLWPSLLLVGTAPALADNLTSAYADAPVAFFFSLAAIGAWRYVVAGERRAVWLFGLMAGAAVATKPEGSPFVARPVRPARDLLPGASVGSLRPLVPAAVWCLIAIVPVADLGLAPRHPLVDAGCRRASTPATCGGGSTASGRRCRSLVEKSFAADWLAILPLVLVAVALVLAPASLPRRRCSRPARSRSCSCRCSGPTGCSGRASTTCSRPRATGP